MTRTSTLLAGRPEEAEREQEEEEEEVEEEHFQSGGEVSVTFFAHVNFGFTGEWSIQHQR